MVEFSPHIFVQNGDPGRMNLAKYLRALMPFVLTANLEAKKQFNGEEQDLVGLVGHLLERLNSLNKSNGDLIGLLYRYVNTKNGYVRNSFCSAVDGGKFQMQFLRILYNLLNQGALSLSDEFGLLSVFIRTIGRAVRTEILNYADIDRVISTLRRKI